MERNAFVGLFKIWVWLVRSCINDKDLVKQLHQGCKHVMYIKKFRNQHFLFYVLCIFQQSLAEIQQVRAKALASPTQDSPGYLLKDSGGGGGGSSSKNSSCDTDDFVMVPAHFPSKTARKFSFKLFFSIPQKRL